MFFVLLDERYFQFTPMQRQCLHSEKMNLAVNPRERGCPPAICDNCKSRDLLVRLVALYTKTPVTSNESIQSAFLEQVRKGLPPNLSFVDELAELLNISRDSAYRRMRGDTVLSLEEVKKLCDHFKISLDSFLSPSSEVVTFQLRAMNVNDFSFDKWLRSILGNLEMVSGFEEKEIVYNAKDLPIFHYFQFPRLSAFKMYFWMKSFARNVKFSAGKYSPDLVDKELIAVGEKIWDKYATLPSTELLSVEIMNVTLRHIEFAHECGMFEDMQEALRLCDDCSLLIGRLKAQAEVGRKSSSDGDEGGGKFDLYYNEVLIGDNTILFKMGDKRVTFLTANNFDILTTAQESFCSLTESHISNLINKSTLISNTAARERSKFFNKIEQRIQEVKAGIA